MTSTDQLNKVATSAAPHERLIRYVVGCVALTIILAYNASDFDITEGNTIMMMAIVLGAGEGIPLLLKKLLPTE